MLTKPWWVPKIRHRLFNRFTATFLLYASGITVLSLARIDSSGQSFLRFEGADKLVHCLFYFGFTFLLALACKGSFTRALVRKEQIIVALIAMIYSGLIELLQGFFTGHKSSSRFRKENKEN